MNQLATISTTDLQIQAKAIAQSGLFSIKNESQALALMLIAHAEGRHPALVALDYDIINGRPAKRAQAMQRDFLASGGKITWLKSDNEGAEAIFSHPQGGELTESFNKDDAVLAGLWGKDNWKKFPKAMFRARVTSSGIRAVFPMATSGMYVPEEVQDFEPKQDENIIDVQSTEIEKPQIEKSRVKPNSTSQFEKAGKSDAWMKSFDAAKTIAQLIDIWGACREENEKAAFADTTQDYIVSSVKDLLGLKDDIDELRTEIEFLTPKLKEVPFGNAIYDLMVAHGKSLKAAAEKEAA